MQPEEAGIEFVKVEQCRTCRPALFMAVRHDVTSRTRSCVSRGPGNRQSGRAGSRRVLPALPRPPGMAREPLDAGGRLGSQSRGYARGELRCLPQVYRPSVRGGGQTHQARPAELRQCDDGRRPREYCPRTVQ
jgi:hypothetical protein